MNKKRYMKHIAAVSGILLILNGSITSFASDKTAALVSGNGADEAAETVDSTADREILPLGRADFLVQTEGSDFLEKYDNDIISYMNEEYGWISFMYFNSFMSGDIRLKSVKTNREITLGSPKTEVIEKYGKGAEFKFDKKKDPLCMLLELEGNAELADSMEQYCEEAIFYNYNGRAQIVFYFSQEEKVAEIVFANCISYWAGEETVRTAQQQLKEAGYECGWNCRR